jgi:hypothetical protein
MVWRTRVSAPITFGAGPQVRDLAQEFQRVGLRLDRVGVGVVDPADHADRVGLHFERLPLGWRRHDLAGRLDRASRGQAHHFACIVRQCRGRHDLHRMESGPIRYVDEREAGLGVAPRPHPAGDRDGRVGAGVAVEDGGAGQADHFAEPPGNRIRL